MFHNIWDNLSHWLIFFRGVGIPPTVICFAKVRLLSKKMQDIWPTGRLSRGPLISWWDGLLGWWHPIQFAAGCLIESPSLWISGSFLCIFLNLLIYQQWSVYQYPTEYQHILLLTGYTNFSGIYIILLDTVDGCEILHQLIDGKHPSIYRFSTILLVVQDFFHPPYVNFWSWYMMATQSLLQFLTGNRIIQETIFVVGTCWRCCCIMLHLANSVDAVGLRSKHNGPWPLEWFFSILKNVTLLLFNSLPWYRWPICRWFTYILRMVIFHGQTVK